MSFKYLICLALLFSSCGVKGPPKAPANTAVPSFINSYLNNTDQEDSFKSSPNKQEENQEEE